MKKKILDLMYHLSVGNINYEYASKQALILFDVMPSLEQFKERRKQLNMSLRDVSARIEVSIATISRIENGSECEYGNVKKLNDFYCSNGA